MIIIAVMTLGLIAAIGIIAWQNIGPGKKTADQTVQTTSTVVSPSPSPSAGPYEPANLMANTTSDHATIWAGYIAHSTVFKEVEGRFKVPTVTCSNKEQSFGAWVGFDGWGGLQTVEQAGITASCSNASAYVKAPPTNGVYYYAWAAMHGAGSYQTFDFAVRPGDVIYSKVSYAGDIYSLTVKNETTGQSGSNTQHCVVDEASRRANGVTDCPRMHAEWIVERPGASQLPHFDKVTLYDNTATTADGKKAYVEGFSNSRADMIQNSLMLANASTLTGKGAFGVAWLASGRTGDY